MSQNPKTPKPQNPKTPKPRKLEKFDKFQFHNLFYLKNNMTEQKPEPAKVKFRKLECPFDL